jgi:hypothetical protein
VKDIAETWLGNSMLCVGYEASSGIYVCGVVLGIKTIPAQWECFIGYARIMLIEFLYGMTNAIVNNQFLPVTTACWAIHRSYRWILTEGKPGLQGCNQSIRLWYI